MSAAATPSHAPPPRPRVVIVGAGFGGLAAARTLARTPADVTVIDCRNYHLFQSLLYQVATAALSPADIAWPIRAILGQQGNASVQMGKVMGVDAGRREVILEDRQVPFDYLVLATGARHSYFGLGAVGGGSCLVPDRLAHRLVVALNWLWSYVTFERGARLIVGSPAEAKVPSGGTRLAA